MRSLFHLLHMRTDQIAPALLCKRVIDFVLGTLIVLLLKSAAARKAFIMTKKLIGLLAGIAVIGGSATLFAQEGTKPANVGEGTLMVKGKNYPLKNAVAYETTIDGEEGIAVVLSGPTISSEKLNEARKSEKEGRDL